MSRSEDVVLNADAEAVRPETTRRSFAKQALLASAGVAIASQLPRFDLEAQSGITDVAILNFALNLEYLEAEFYTVLTTGKTLEQSGIGVGGTGTQGATIGGAKLSLNSNVMALALEIAADEQAHVKLLRSALGAAAIAKPAIDLTKGGVTDELSFLKVARQLEDVGVSAYGGAAPLISDKNILGTAARIALTEAEHTGAIRELVYQWTIVRPTAIDSLDIVDRIFSVDRVTGLTNVRTPSQVLGIVFQNTAAGTRTGGLFPNGVNGTINAV